MKNEQSLKNIVVLRNLPSNLIDEAIIILKDYSEPKIDVKNNENNKYIIDEANLIVSEYIDSQGKQKQKISQKIEKKYKKTKLLNKCLIVISFILFCIIIH